MISKVLRVAALTLTIEKNMKPHNLFTSSLINYYIYIIIYLLIAGGITPAFLCQTFSNADPITFSDNNTALLYPSSISVTGVSGTISSLTITLNNLSSSAPSNLDMLLVGSLGQEFIIMNAAGGSSSINNINLTFSDGAPSSLTTPISSGTYKPTVNAFSANFSSSAPAGPYNYPEPLGRNTDPNGIWS